MFFPPAFMIHTYIALSSLFSLEPSAHVRPGETQVHPTAQDRYGAWTRSGRLFVNPRQRQLEPFCQFLRSQNVLRLHSGRGRAASFGGVLICCRLKLFGNPPACALSSLARFPSLGSRCFSHARL